jgi:hypothetical protein
MSWGALGEPPLGLAARPPPTQWVIAWNMDQGFNHAGWTGNWECVKGKMFRRARMFEGRGGRDSVPILVGLRIPGSGQPEVNATTLHGWDNKLWVHGAAAPRS